MNVGEKQRASLEKTKGELRIAKRQVRVARRLLERALDALPNYTDGRNDRLSGAIEKYLGIG